MQDQNLEFITNRINSKLIDISDALSLISENAYLQKLSYKNETPYRATEIANTSHGTNSGLFSKILESAQLLRDQIEEDIDHQILIDQSRALFQDLQVLFHGLKQFGPMTARKSYEMNYEISNFNNSIMIASETKSPAKLSVRNTLVKVQEEVTGRLKNRIDALRSSNLNDVTQQLQIQIDRHNELNEKYEGVKKAFHATSIVVREELFRCLNTLDDVLIVHIDNVLITRLKRDLVHFKTQVGNLFSKQGQLFDPQNEHSDLQFEFERQRTAWEASLSRQKDCFAEEKRKLEETLTYEVSFLKKEKEAAMKHTKKLENDLKTIGEEKDRLKFEVERLQRVCKEERLSSEEIIGTTQNKLEVEKQTTNCLQAQIQELQKIIEERESALLQASKANAELQKKCAELEVEVLRLTGECTGLNKDKNALVEQVSHNDLNIKELSKKVESLAQQTLNIVTENKRLTQELNDKEKSYEHDREKLTTMLENVQREYHNYIERTKSTSTESEQNYNFIVTEYDKKLEQQKKELENFKSTVETELRAKKDEVRELNFQLHALKEASSSQEANLKKKEEKLNVLIEERKGLQEKALSLELLMRESASTQEKSKKYFDLLSASNEELGNIKAEVQSLLEEKKETEQRYELLTLENKRLQEEIEQLKEYNIKTNQRLNESIHEAKILREQLETEQDNISRKEKELK